MHGTAAIYLWFLGVGLAAGYPVGSPDDHLKDVINAIYHFRSITHVIEDTMLLSLQQRPSMAAAFVAMAGQFVGDGPAQPETLGREVVQDTLPRLLRILARLMGAMTPSDRRRLTSVVRALYRSSGQEDAAFDEIAKPMQQLIRKSLQGDVPQEQIEYLVAIFDQDPSEE